MKIMMIMRNLMTTMKEKIMKIVIMKTMKIMKNMKVKKRMIIAMMMIMMKIIMI